MSTITTSLKGEEAYEYSNEFKNFVKKYLMNIAVEAAEELEREGLQETPVKIIHSTNREYCTSLAYFKANTVFVCFQFYVNRIKGVADFKLATYSQKPDAEDLKKGYLAEWPSFYVLSIHPMKEFNSKDYSKAEDLYRYKLKSLEETSVSQIENPVSAVSLYCKEIVAQLTP